MTKNVSVTPEQMSEAKRVYLKGMSENYPLLDPRVELYSDRQHLLLNEQSYWKLVRKQSFGHNLYIFTKATLPWLLMVNLIIYFIK